MRAWRSVASDLSTEKDQSIHKGEVVFNIFDNHATLGGQQMKGLKKYELNFSKQMWGEGGRQTGSLKD